MENYPFIDIHTHNLKSKSDETRIFCQTAIESQLPPSLSTSYFTAGIHPWFLEKYCDPEGKIESQWQRKLTELLAMKNCVGLGETGLDRTLSLPLNIQERAFEEQLNLCNDLGINFIVLHCVRAYPEVLAHIKKFPAITFLFHDFHGNTEILSNVLKEKNIFLGIGKILERAHQEKHQQTIMSLPLERIFLETDDSDQEITDRYRLFSELRDFPLTKLREEFFKNWTNLAITL